tara:strand:+ start:778 stop:1152 length:375 start_codon:yes stop_codon:yes gene_type:complete
MAGLIWFVQIVHYPLFHKVSADTSVAYADEHQTRTAWVVGLPMLIEGITTVWLFFDPVGSRVFPLIGGLVLAKVHLSTIFLQVPRHGELTRGYNRETVSKLVTSNWVRTIGWSVRAGIAVAIVA